MGKQTIHLVYGLFHRFSPESYEQGFAAGLLTCPTADRPSHPPQADSDPIGQRIFTDSQLRG